MANRLRYIQVLIRSISFTYVIKTNDLKHQKKDWMLLLLMFVEKYHIIIIHRGKYLLAALYSMPLSKLSSDLHDSTRRSRSQQQYLQSLWRSWHSLENFQRSVWDKILCNATKIYFHQLTCYRHSFHFQPRTHWIVVELSTWRIQDTDFLQQFSLGNELRWSSC